MKPKKIIYCLIGASGSGKTTVGSILKTMGYEEIVSHTTRKKRYGEVEGVHYYFVSKNEFNNIPMVEKNQFSGELYGTSFMEIEEKMKFTNKLFQVTSYSGYKKLKEKFPDYNVVSIVVTSSPETRKTRMSLRGDSKSSIERRLKEDSEEASKMEIEHVNYVFDNETELSNEKLKEKISSLLEIIDTDLYFNYLKKFVL